MERPQSMFLLKITYRMMRSIIPTCLYLVYLFKNPKIIKFIIPWFTSNFNPNRNTVKDETIWITFEAKEWLEDFLDSSMAVFEYGSGGSTIFFSKRVKNLVSVEHNLNWYQYLKELLKEKNILNCKYLFFEPQKIYDNLDFSNPGNFASKEYPNISFEAYVKSIELFPDKTFDLILIDGRARPSCILFSLNKVKPGGVMMVDNSERFHYQLAAKLLIDWERKDFFGPGPYGFYFWQTSVWKKPLKEG